MGKKTDPETQPEQTEEPEAKVFTQEEVNRIAGQRVLEERGKYKDYDALKARALVADKLEQAQLTEKEKLTRQLAEAQRKAADTETRVAEMAINAAIQVAASRMGLVDPDAAAALVARTGITYADDKVQGVDDALTALIAVKPWLKGQAKAPNLNANDGHPAPAPVKLTADQIAVAGKLGVKAEDYAKHIR